MRLVLILLASCASTPSTPGMEEMRRSRVEGSCAQIPTIDCNLLVEGEVFYVNGLFTDNESSWLPSDDGIVSRLTTISSVDGGMIRCESDHEVDVGYEGGLYHTLGMSMRCKGVRNDSSLDVFLEGWPSVEGLVVLRGREYTITSRGRTRPEALLVAERGSTLRLVVGRTSQIWIRRGLPRDERKALIRLAAVLWTSPGLRAHEGSLE